jgi:hypothetical protein
MRRIGKWVRSREVVETARRSRGRGVFISTTSGRETPQDLVGWAERSSVVKVEKL